MAVQLDVEPLIIKKINKSFVSVIVQRQHNADIHFFHIKF